MKTKQTLFSKFKAIAKKSQNGRRFSELYQVVGGKAYYSDGFFLVCVNTAETGMLADGVYTLDNIKVDEKYPNVFGVMPNREIKTLGGVLLNVGDLIKPNKKGVSIDRNGQLNNADAEYSCNLAHVNMAVALGCKTDAVSDSGMFIFANDAVQVYSAGVMQIQPKTNYKG